jgi:hypothetical protein
VIVARRATVALLSVFSLAATACHRTRTVTLAPEVRARVYASVLADLRADTAARWQVIDSLLPVTDLDADLHEKVMTELRVSSATLHGFLTAQRTPVDRFQLSMLPGDRFAPLRMAQVDSMRRKVREDIASGAAERGVNNDLFWRRWSGAFPGSASYVILSPAMISLDGREAMVHVRVVCGAVCGQAQLRHLTRDAGGAWRTTAKVTLSES